VKSEKKHRLFMRVFWNALDHALEDARRYQQLASVTATIGSRLTGGLE